MPINATYEYFEAEKKYLAAQTPEEQIICIEEMIRTAPHHKGSENLLAALKKRIKKIKEKQETTRKAKKSASKGIRKEGFQFIILGPTNTGKSSLLKVITNASPKIADYAFTTKTPEIGTFNFEGIRAQVIDLPAFGSETLDKSLVYTADMLLIVLEDLNQIELLPSYMSSISSKRVYIINKVDLLTEQEKRKLVEKIKSKRINALLVSTKTLEGIQELKKLMASSMNIIRVYLKEPGKTATNIPQVLPINSTVKDSAEEILKGFSARIKESRVTGPSSKFPNQKVGLTHTLKDRDILEFHTK